MTADDFTALTPELWRYAVDHSSFRDEAVLEVEAAAREMGELAEMQIGGDQAALITILARSIGARRAIEVGTFLGYGAISIARGLPEDGKLVVCELREEYAGRAREHLERAGLAHRVEIRVGPAVETLRAMEDAGSYEFAFIDADKTGYPDYYEECLRLLRPNGLMLIDNVFRGGDVLETGGDEGGAVIRGLNDLIAADERVDAAMVPIADGVTVVRKK
jgi:predicted O-methyltransferase YrrM